MHVYLEKQAERMAENLFFLSIPSVESKKSMCESQEEMWYICAENWDHSEILQWDDPQAPLAVLLTVISIPG